MKRMIGVTVVAASIAGFAQEQKQPQPPAKPAATAPVVPAEAKPTSLPPATPTSKPVEKPVWPPPPDAKGWITLFNGTDLTGWKLRHGTKSGWSVKEGVLMNTVPSVDIISELPHGDIELHFEFAVPKASNSGVYLQGRYEIQVDDAAGQPIRNTMCGSIYGLIAPKYNVSKPTGEWQSFDVIFRQPTSGADGKKNRKALVTVIHNNYLTIHDAEIERPTGAAVDNQEGVSAGLLLQGDHGPISFRNIKIRPLNPMPTKPTIPPATITDAPVKVPEAKK